MHADCHRLGVHHHHQYLELIDYSCDPQSHYQQVCCLLASPLQTYSAAHPPQDPVQALKIPYMNLCLGGCAKSRGDVTRTGTLSQDFLIMSKVRFDTCSYDGQHTYLV